MKSTKRFERKTGATSTCSDNSLNIGRESEYNSRNISETGWKDTRVTETRTSAISDSGRKMNTNVTRDYVRKSEKECQQQNGVRITQRNFLSKAEFPDVQSAASIKDINKIDKSYHRNGQMKRHSTNKVAKFKPFDANKAPANFQNCNMIVNSQKCRQNFQNCNPGMMNGQQFYTAQGPVMYQYIPPQEYGQAPQPIMNMYVPSVNAAVHPTGSSATAVAPNGEKIFIPLDDSRYEIKRSNHDLYEMPQDCDLYPLSSEGNFESNVQVHSPRPIDIRGSLSDEWSGSSQDGPYSETESELDTELETETDASEVANNFVADVLKTITESVENLAFQSSEDQDRSNAEGANTVEQVSCENNENNVTDIETFKELPMKCVQPKKEDFDLKEILVQTNKPNETQITAIDSSSSETDEPITKKRAKVNNESKGLEEKSTKLEALKGNKKPKNKKPHAWKENRKEKQDKTKTNNRHEVTVESTSERKVYVDGGERDTENSLNECAGNSPAEESQDNVIIDGQGYFKTHQLQNGQYQPYYTPDTYTFVPNQYQQCQYSTAPEYTMFVHDACPPPAQDEVYSQVHKSLSGEVINNYASVHQSQTLAGGNSQQEASANVSGASEEQIHSNTEAAVSPVVHYENYCATNGSSPHAWTSCETQPVYNQFSSGTVANQSEQQSEGQGQIYISYDEDSVYVDPESGLSYPALHVTDDFLITVILREGVFLEITADKVLRLVNHEKKLVVAINETGNKACVIHPAARIYQSDSNMHAELYLGRRAKMTEELVIFGNKLKTYKFDNRMVTEMTEEPVYRDLSHDESVSFLSTDGAIGNEEMKLKIEEILAHAHFWKNGTSGAAVVINGTKVVQNERGDVSVYCGPIKFLRMNPNKMILRLKTQCIEVDIETNWNVKITRGAHALNASHMGFIVSNGKIKASLDSNNNLHSFSMPDHRFLMLGQPVSHHRPGVPGGQWRRTSYRKTEPEGDHWGYVRRRPDDDQSLFRDWEEGWDYDFNNRNCHRRWDPQAGRWVYPSRPRHWQEYS